MLLGITLVGIGNLLPRRPNMALSIRTRHASDRQLWMLTHRLSGYATVAVSIVTLFARCSSGRQVAAVPASRSRLPVLLLAGYWKFSRVASPQHCFLHWRGAHPAATNLMSPRISCLRPHGRRRSFSYLPTFTTPGPHPRGELTRCSAHRRRDPQAI